MLDQGNPCGGFRWRNWSKSGVGVRLPKRNPPFLPHFSQPGYGDAMGGIGNPLEGGAARVQLPSKRLASLERDSPLDRARTPAFGHLA
jgi:hypothetical protein